MSIVLELEANGRKAGRVCEGSYRKGPGCPLIVRQTSEDVLTANVFGLLRRLRPGLWLRPMLNKAFRTGRFQSRPMKHLAVEFWKPVPPPSNRLDIEGNSEIDVAITFESTVVFTEAKYRSPLSASTSHDPNRDQLIRLLDVAYSTARTSDLFPREPFVFVLGLPRTEPELVTRYRNPNSIAEALAHHRRFPDHSEMAEYLALHVGYLSWSSLGEVLRTSGRRATSLEAALLVDVARYIDHKVVQASRSLTTQGSFTLPGMEAACSHLPTP